MLRIIREASGIKHKRRHRKWLKTYLSNLHRVTWLPFLLRNPLKSIVNSCFASSHQNDLLHKDSSPRKNPWISYPSFPFLFFSPKKTHLLELSIANNSSSTWGVFLSPNFLLCIGKTLFLNFKQCQSLHITYNPCISSKESYRFQKLLQW